MADRMTKYRRKRQALTMAGPRPGLHIWIMSPEAPSQTPESRWDQMRPNELYAVVARTWWRVV